MIRISYNNISFLCTKVYHCFNFISSTYIEFSKSFFSTERVSIVMSNRLEALFTVKVTNTFFSLTKFDLFPYITDHIHQWKIKIQRILCNWKYLFQSLSWLEYNLDWFVAYFDSAIIHSQLSFLVVYFVSLRPCRPWNNDDLIDKKVYRHFRHNSTLWK